MDKNNRVPKICPALPHEHMHDRLIFPCRTDRWSYHEFKRLGRGLVQHAKRFVIADHRHHGHSILQTAFYGQEHIRMGKMWSSRVTGQLGISFGRLFNDHHRSDKPVLKTGKIGKNRIDRVGRFRRLMLNIISLVLIVQQHQEAKRNQVDSVENPKTNKKPNMSMHGVWAQHVLSDMLSSVGVVASGLIRASAQQYRWLEALHWYPRWVWS